MIGATAPVPVWRQTAAFLLVTVCGSLLASAVLMTWGFASDPAKLEDQHTLSDFAGIYFGGAVLAWLFVLPTGVVIGIPAVLLARRFGLAATRTRFLLLGVGTGIVVWGASTTVLLTAGEEVIETMPWWLLFGALTGGLGGLLWWQLVERYRTAG